MAVNDEAMSFRHFILIIPLFAAAANARTHVGSFATWAAFCDERTKCFAISEPSGRRSAAFLAFAISGRGPLLRAHIGRPVRTAILHIGTAHFVLATSGEDVTADLRLSRRIVSALRENETLSIAGIATDGGRFRHRYGLVGAPSAIDAAVIASRR